MTDPDPFAISGAPLLHRAGVLALLALLATQRPVLAQAGQTTGDRMRVEVHAPLEQHSVLAGASSPDDLLAGKADASPVINAALSKGGVFLPCGTYRLDGPLTPLGQTAPFLRGAGRSCVELHVRFGAGDVIVLGKMGAPGLGVGGPASGGLP